MLSQQLDILTILNNYILFIYMIVFWIVLGIVCAIFVYNDAKRKTIKGLNGIGWAIACFFLGLVGVLIYQIAKKSKQ